MKQILPLDPVAYKRHLIHGEGRIWAETNCYVDVWIELLHGSGFEPIAALPFTLAIDFEGDQWTFFKFPLADIYELYGFDVQELAIMWRPLISHVEEQVGLGRFVLVELDSMYLPDTSGTAYKTAHVKSTVAVNAIDVPNRWMGYFHNQGYYQLSGDDFTNVFRLNDPPGSDHLPPYVEFVKRRPVEHANLGRKSLDTLRRQLTMLPAVNPFVSFKARFARDFDWLSSQTLDVFHQYSFVTWRQFGACYELSATYLTWLAQKTGLDFSAPIKTFTEISTDAKTLQFQLARSIVRKKPLDLAALDQMARQWQSAIDGVRATVNSVG